MNNINKIKFNNKEYFIRDTLSAQSTLDLDKQTSLASHYLHSLHEKVGENPLFPIYDNDISYNTLYSSYFNGEFNRDKIISPSNYNYFITRLVAGNFDEVNNILKDILINIGDDGILYQEVTASIKMMGFSNYASLISHIDIPDINAAKLLKENYTNNLVTITDISSSYSGSADIDIFTLLFTNIINNCYYVFNR